MISKNSRYRLGSKKIFRTNESDQSTLGEAIESWLTDSVGEPWK